MDAIDREIRTLFRRNFVEPIFWRPSDGIPEEHEDTAHEEERGWTLSSELSRLYSMVPDEYKEPEYGDEECESDENDTDNKNHENQ